MTGRNGRNGKDDRGGNVAAWAHRNGLRTPLNASEQVHFLRRK